METIINELPGSKVELKFTVSIEEAQPYLDKAVEDLGSQKAIPGFRPGKAPYEEIKKVLGEMTIWQHALERIVRAKYVSTVLEKKLDTIGSPEVAVDQLTPGQEIKFTCTASVMPKITNAEELKEAFVEMNVKDVKDSDIEGAIEELRKMRRQEVASDQPADKDGMVLVDLEMKKDGVLLEGGQAKDYKIYLNEGHYVPKLTEQLVGSKKGEQKSFKLPFPEDHFQKIYAGKDIDFDVNVKEVYGIKLPEVNDEFTKTLGVESVQALKDLLLKNITQENERKALEIAEIELLETLVDKSRFTEVPEILIKEEIRRMYSELQNDIERQGGRMEDYLSSIKKTADELRLDMVPQAIKRVQTAVYIKHIATENKIDVTDAEIDQEIDRLLNIAPDKESKERLASPEYRDYVYAMMRNRKTLEFLKDKGIKNYKEALEKFAKEEAERVAQRADQQGGHVHGPDCQH
ncbi:trigger factor [Patescibacteria group bacterium]|nr:trigger factor [Patescibacteria group bacterium]